MGACRFLARHRRRPRLRAGSARPGRIEPPRPPARSLPRACWRVTPVSSSCSLAAAPAAWPSSPDAARNGWFATGRGAIASPRRTRQDPRGARREACVVEHPSDQPATAEPRATDAPDGDAIDRLARGQQRAGVLVGLAPRDDGDLGAGPRERERQIRRHLAGGGVIGMEVAVDQDDARHAALGRQGAGHRVSMWPMKRYATSPITSCIARLKAPRLP